MEKINNLKTSWYRFVIDINKDKKSTVELRSFIRCSQYLCTDEKETELVALCNHGKKINNNLEEYKSIWMPHLKKNFGDSFNKITFINNA